MRLPEWYYRNCQQSWCSMNQCRLLFVMCPQINAPDPAKVTLAISLLAGDALGCASPLLEGHSPVLSDWDAFLQLVNQL